MTLFGYELAFRGSNYPRRGRSSVSQNLGFSLAQVKPGQQVKVLSFLPGLSSERAWHLQSYGVVKGCQLRVTQQSPVTIIQVEHLELALEQGLARFIQVAET